LTPITTKNPTSITIGIRATITNVLHKQKYIYWLILQNANNTTIFNISNSINASSMPNLEIYREVPLSDYSKNLSGFVWWTWDLGTPVLFNFTLIVSAAHSNAKVHKTVLTGFRTVSVVQEKDPQGTSFIVNLNGYDVFMRGASYIPPEMMMDTATPATYARIKQYALHAKLNMIRLWGGGQFENDEFYTAMDESGILIWHDLMFACAMYPATLIGRELESIQQELEDNLIRIRNHPSIALWSGNNEVWIGWQEWGWKNGHDTLEIYQLERMYKQIFK
jgi:beta-mannosidase